MQIGLIIFLAILALVILITLAKSITIIHQAEKGIVERFGSFKETPVSYTHLTLPTN